MGVIMVGHCFVRSGWLVQLIARGSQGSWKDGSDEFERLRRAERGLWLLK